MSYLQLRQWIQERQALEVMLAWNLVDAFNNSSSLIGPLRQMARRALDEIRELKKTSPMASAVLTQVWHSQMGIVDLCKREDPPGSGRKKYAGFNTLVAEQLDAQDCSDLVRLYGEFIERAAKAGVKGAAGDRDDWQLQNVLRDSRRVDFGVPTAQNKIEGAIWNKTLPEFGRHRKDQAPVAESTVHEFLISQKGGSARVQLADTSTVNRMDRLFGLVPAADISGTTTDSIYFMERFKTNAGELDPVYQLLPLATIVAGAHHSMLEVALSLSLNGIIDYRIGAYGTLFPRASKVAEAGAVRGSLTVAENHPHNRQMLVYYSQPWAPAGCFLFEGQEREAFWRFAKATSMLRSCRTLPPWPAKDDVRAFCGREGLRLPDRAAAATGRG